MRAFSLCFDAVLCPPYIGPGHGRGNKATLESDLKGMLLPGPCQMLKDPGKCTESRQYQVHQRTQQWLTPDANSSLWLAAGQVGCPTPKSLNQCRCMTARHWLFASPFRRRAICTLLCRSMRPRHIPVQEDAPNWTSYLQPRTHIAAVIVQRI